ncbi:MAG: M42 family metallopeptidase [Chloroflexota bacterium]
MMQDLIKKLAETWGPSGYEHHVRAVIREEVADLADEITVDPLGNLICRVGSGGARVMVAAHMDEIGLMATYREPTSGYMRFENIGGLLHTTLAGSRVRFEDGTVGTIGVHDQWGASRTKVSSLDQFYIDVSDGEGTAFREGQPAVLDGPVFVRGSRVVGRGMDDRVGCVVAIEAMRRLKDNPPQNEVYFVFTVQEEVGLRGAQAAGYSISPDVAIAVDVTATGDQPHNLKMSVKLGEGTAIKVLDKGLVVPPAVRDWMVETAEANNIPYQLELLPMGSTDAAAIQRSGSGVPGGVVSIPCRYVHTISETVDMADVEASVDLLAALVAAPVALQQV